MSIPLTALVEHIGDENIQIQNLAEATESMRHRGGATFITFGTHAISGGDLASHLTDGKPLKLHGLVLWVPRERLPDPKADLVPASVKLTETREKLAQAYRQLSGKTEHTSDCATSVSPGECPGPCNCDTPKAKPLLRVTMSPEGEAWLHVNLADGKQSGCNLGIHRPGTIVRTTLDAAAKLTADS